MEKTGGWAAANEAIARKLLSLRDNTDEAFDCLAWALETSCIQFPIFEEQECLDRIDPFSFIASWSRPMPDARRARLLRLVCDALDIDVAIPEHFDGYPLVQDWQARMFSRDSRNVPREIDALWNLLDAALSYADAMRGQASEGRADETRTAVLSAGLTRAYDDLSRVRCPAKKCVPILLAWVAPDVFFPLGNCSGAESSQFPFFERGPMAPYIVSETPCLDAAKTPRLLEAFAGDSGEGPEGVAAASVRAASTFLEHWDIDSPDFAGMLAAALADSGTLLFGGYSFNPLREINVFAQAEPELMRAAFGALFDETLSVEERAVPFMRSTCALFERHRGEIARATACGSAHGSFKTVAAYLYLRYPETHFPFSPNKLRVLDSLCGYRSHFRLTKPECLSQYDALCGDLRAELAKRADMGELLEKHGLSVGAARPLPSLRVRENALVDELAAFACKHERDAFL